MKKLLRLLGTITIASSTMPTVIATSSLQKEIKKVGDLDELNWMYLTTIRNKRNTENGKTKPVFKTDGADKPTEQQIKNRVKEKNQSVDITKIKVENITVNSAVVSIAGFSGKITINFTVDKSVPINRIIKNTNLGEIDIDGFGGNYDENLLKHFLKNLNPQLDSTKIKVENITLNTAKITSIDTSIYIGETNINYTRPLRLLIKKIELGPIRTNGTDKPSEQQIKDKLKELNNNLKNIINDFEIKDITLRDAKITYSKRKDFYSGSVKVNFLSNVNLNKIITNTTLGEFETINLSNPTEQQIKNRVKEKNQSVDITKIKVENITNNSATINSYDTIVYTGNIGVNYTISIKSLNWE
ncbi:hypothetical protein [Spiroplasma endosymbiont of Dromius quadrimaculatus]|uniref:hypothetical protein n=1 Tax=Spiroplasma endosymbiont of Dromius quadrimaculatus TaxID=3066283 RepID=UPI00313B2CED